MLAIARQSPRRTSQPTHTRLYTHFRGVWKKAVRWRNGRVKATAAHSCKNTCSNICTFCFVEDTNVLTPMLKKLFVIEAGLNWVLAGQKRMIRVNIYR